MRSRSRSGHVRYRDAFGVPYDVPLRLVPEFERRRRVLLLISVAAKAALLVLLILFGVRL